MLCVCVCCDVDAGELLCVCVWCVFVESVPERDAGVCVCVRC